MKYRKQIIKSNERSGTAPCTLATNASRPDSVAWTHSDGPGAVASVLIASSNASLQLSKLAWRQNSRKYLARNPRPHLSGCEFIPLVNSRHVAVSKVDGLADFRDGVCEDRSCQEGGEKNQLELHC